MNYKLLFLSVLFSLSMSFNNDDVGQLVSYELIEYKDYQEILNTLLDILNPVPYIQYSVSLYKITYSTIDQHGNPTIASGAIAIPETEDFRPLLSFQHGTVVEKSNTISQQGFDIVSMWLGSAGFISLFPDYLGLGESEVFHPYQIYRPSATVIRDMIRASQKLLLEPEFNQSSNWNGQLFITGYSEGGYTTLSAQKLIEEEHPYEFNITASAPCAGAYDMSGVMYDLMMSEQSYAKPYYLPYVFFAYNDTYNFTNDITEYLKDEYALVLLDLFDGTHSSGEIDAVMPSIPIHIFKDTVVDEIQADYNHPIRIALRENDIYDWTPKSTTKLIHSENDELVPIENSIVAYNQFIENGSESVELEYGAWGSHQDAAGLIVLGVANWFNDLIIDSEPVTFELTNLNIEERTLDVFINNPSNLLGIQFDMSDNVSVDIENTSDQFDFLWQTNGTTLIGFDLVGSLINPGYHYLMTLKYDENYYSNKICSFNAIIADENSNALNSINSCILLTEQSLFGDVNGDLELNILDILLLVNHIIGESELSNNQISNSDFNHDSQINIIDILQLLNLILSN